MTTYKAVLFAPDGDYVTDYAGSESVEAVEERLADQGSRWYFYPFPVVIRDRGALTTGTQRIVSVCEPYEWAKGRTLRTFGRFLDTHPEWVEAVLS